MKRRALLSGIVPAVAGAAGACRSSVANALTGGVRESSAGIRNLEVMYLIINQWLATLMKHSNGLVPKIYERVSDSDDRLEGGVIVNTTVEIDTTQVFNAENWSVGDIGMSRLMDEQLFSALIPAGIKCMDKVLKTVPVLCPHTHADQFPFVNGVFPIQNYHSVTSLNIPPESDYDAIEYLIEKTDTGRLPMSLNVKLKSVSKLNNFVTSSAVIEIEYRSSIKRHAGKILAYKKCLGSIHKFNA